MSMNSISFSKLKSEIKSGIEGLKKEYTAAGKEVDSSKFETAAKRITEQVLSRYSDTYKDDDKQVKELQNFIDSTISSQRLDAKEEKTKSGAEKAVSQSTAVSSKSNSSTTNYGFDYDPYTENGISIYPIGETVETVDEKGNRVTTTKLKNRALTSIYHSPNNSYSGCDMVVSVTIAPNGDLANQVTTVVGELSTITYSIYQDKKPIRVLGNMNAKDYVFGSRTIAGSLVFAVFNKHWLVNIYDELRQKAGMKNWHFIADEIPPMTITISASNEYGYDSKMALYGVRLMQEGQTMSIQDIFTENTYQFVATDIDYLDTIYSYQSRADRHKTVKISQPVQDRGVVNAVIQPTEIRMNYDDADPVKIAEKTLEAAKNELIKNINSDWTTTYNELKDAGKTKSAMLKKYKEKYNSLKDNKNFNDKAKNELKIYYETACEEIKDIYKVQKELDKKEIKK